MKALKAVSAVKRTIKLRVDHVLRSKHARDVEALGGGVDTQGGILQCLSLVETFSPETGAGINSVDQFAEKCAVVPVLGKVVDALFSNLESLNLRYLGADPL